MMLWKCSIRSPDSQAIPQVMKTSSASCTTIVGFEAAESSMEKAAASHIFASDEMTTLRRSVVSAVENSSRRNLKIETNGEVPRDCRPGIEWPPCSPTKRCLAGMPVVPAAWRCDRRTQNLSRTRTTSTGSLMAVWPCWASNCAGRPCDQASSGCGDWMSAVWSASAVAASWNKHWQAVVATSWATAKFAPVAGHSWEQTESFGGFDARVGSALSSAGDSSQKVTRDTQEVGSILMPQFRS